MKLESLVSVEITESELVEAIKTHIQCDMNEHVPYTPEFNKYDQLVKHMDNNVCHVEFSNGNFYLTIDGVFKKEDL